MGKVLDKITDELRAFITRQHVFFVATAPLEGEGHINLSPKGLDSFRVLSPHQVAYLDLTGSGNETAAHLAENGRVTFMFCAFEGAPQILRLYGTGRVILPGAPDWDHLLPRFQPHVGIRQIVLADINRIQTSCGYAVPRLAFVEERDTLTRWAEKKGPAALAAYRRENNQRSIDGLPAPRAAGD